LTGQREFWGLEFRVTPDVLIPRPETELLIETVLTLRPDRSKSGTLVDVGTGSGCIAVALAIELPAMTVIATDTSQAALEVARANATRHGVAEHIDWRHGSLLAGFSGPVDLIVSNPPYVSALAIQHLEPEIRDHEPHLALNGGSDGAVPLRALVAEAGVALVDDGLLVVEFGCNQETAFRQIIAMSGLSDPKVVRDLQGLPRIGVAAYRDSR
jgi:release factor glutamine methyltransferase